jgi:Zn-dependent M28 family amino/carboxypeptidase
VDADRFMADFEHLVRTYPDRANNVPDHLGVRDHMASVFEQAGMEVWRHAFTDGIEQENIAGILWGVDRTQVIVVGGHYDTFSIDCAVTERVDLACPGRYVTGGAYDNGSGTAMTLELAKAFAGTVPYYTILFVAFDGEERGLEGSRAIADAITDGVSPLGEVTMRAHMNLDMTGLNWPGVSTPVGAWTHSDALRDIMDGIRTDLGVPDDMVDYKPGRGSSDHESFAAYGVPNVFFFSNFGKQGLPMTPAGPTPTVPGVYPFWHQADTWETLLVSAGGPQNLKAGSEVALRLAAGLIHALAFEGLAAE